MPSRDWDTWDDDEFPRVHSDRGSGGVVAVGVISLVMCFFNAVYSGCFMLCGAFFGAFGQPNPNNNFLAPGMVQYTAVLMVALGITSAVSFVLQIAAGVGLLNSRRWARTLSLYLGATSVLVAAVLVFLVIKLFSSEMNQEEMVMQLMFWGTGLVFHAAYAFIVFIVLLSRRAIASLR